MSKNIYKIQKLFVLLVIFISQSANAIENLSLTRSDKGTQITAAEKQVATDEFIKLLIETKYFDFVASRIHGQTENIEKNNYWWANMWTGVVATKENGIVTYTHSADGSDNVGIHTAPYLEGACFAYMLTGDKKLELLTRRLMRGFSSWIISSQNSESSFIEFNQVNVLSRSQYPDSFSTEINGIQLNINYEATHPGINNGVAEFVPVKNNILGNLWVKNNRSIDDIGHMIRAIAQVQACRPYFSESATKDLDQMNTLYKSWAKTVVESNFIIPTLNSNSNRYLPKNGLGDYNFYNLGIFNPNCTGKLAINLMFDKDKTNFECGHGISALEKILGLHLHNDPIEIQRANHISAIAMADLNQLTNVSNKLRKGLAKRIDRDFKITKNPSKYPNLDVQDIFTFLVHANNVGIPLKSEETRFIYDRLHIAFKEMLSEKNYNTFHLFDKNIPDGKYSFDPPNQGLYFYTLGAMIGTCNSAFKNQNSESLFDCERLKVALRNNI